MRHSIDTPADDYSDSELLSDSNMDMDADELDAEILDGLGNGKSLGMSKPKKQKKAKAKKSVKMDVPAPAYDEAETSPYGGQSLDYEGGDQSRDASREHLVASHDHPKTVHWPEEDVDENYPDAIPLKEVKKPKKNTLKSIIKKGKSKFGGGSSEDSSSYSLLGGGRRSSLSGGRSGRYNKVNFNRFATDSSEEDSDADSDFGQISIDVENRPRRKVRHQNTKTLNLMLFALLIIAVYFILTLTFGGNTGPKGRPSTYKAREKILLHNGTHDFHPTTLVISLDGFHPHYISPELTPHLDNLMRKESGAPYMLPSFPTSTFPNHWTLITGLYPSSHGIVGNTFFDPDLDKQFVNTDPSQSRDVAFWGGEPIWQTLSYQNVSTAVHMWPGSEAKWAPEDAPLIVDPFNQSEALYKKLDRLTEWLDRPLQSRPELMLTYVPTVDTLGHIHGISGPDLEQGIHEVDLLVGAFREALELRNLTDVVNLVVLSDHGMAPTSDERLIFLDDLIDVSQIDHIDGWPLVGLRPGNNMTESELFNKLKKQEPENESWKVYTRKNLPARWNFGGKTGGRYQNRLAPVWIIPKTGWSLLTHEDYAKMDNSYQPHGTHGYDNRDILMRALFLGAGPYFPDFKFEPFSNVNVYSILCDTLHVYPSKNDAQPLTKALIRLNEDWQDDSDLYPGVDFSTSVVEGSTYDELYRAEGHANGTVPTSGQEPSKQKGGKKQSWAEYLKGQTNEAIDWLADKWAGIVGHD